MIRAIVVSSWKQLARDRAAQVVSFIVPILFFTIMVTIFGSSTGSSGPPPRTFVPVADESSTATSRALIAALADEANLRVRTAPGDSGGTAPSYDRAAAEHLVRTGQASVALVLPAGIDTSLFRYDGRGVKVIAFTDPGDPVGPRVATGLLQRAAIRAMQKQLGAAESSSPEELAPARIEERPVAGTKKGLDGADFAAFYAAGVAVMFLMFSASGAGGALIEEQESGTLERVLTSGLGMSRLLLAKWVWLSLLGIGQVSLMFLWAQLLFHVPLFAHLPGFLLITVATAACTAAFGLVLATLARTRQQLQGMANVIVLSLSAIGGSMFPRFLMPEWMQKFSLIGFNAWALEGYLGVFWRDSPFITLLGPVAALVGFAALFLFIARRVARRWEAA